VRSTRLQKHLAYVSIPKAVAPSRRFAIRKNVDAPCTAHQIAKNKNSGFPQQSAPEFSRLPVRVLPCQSAQKETGGAVSQAPSGGNPSPSTEAHDCTANAVSVLISAAIFPASDVRTGGLRSSSACPSITLVGRQIRLETDCATPVPRAKSKMRSPVLASNCPIFCGYGRSDRFRRQSAWSKTVTAEQFTTGPARRKPESFEFVKFRLDAGVAPPDPHRPITIS